MIAAYVHSEGKLAITSAAGTLALFAYVVAIVALLSVVRDGDRGRGEAWSIVGPAGAVAGPAVGAVALALQATLVLRVDEGVSPEVVGLLHDARLGLQTVAGLPVVLLVTLGLAAAWLLGLYLASSLVYARAVTAPWDGLWIMVVGIVALSVPVLVATLSHLEVFDFGRLQAWAWVLFAAFAIAATATLLGVGRPEPHLGRSADDHYYPIVMRALTTGVAIALAAVSVMLWPEGTPTCLDGYMLCQAC